VERRVRVLLPQEPALGLLLAFRRRDELAAALLAGGQLYYFCCMDCKEKFEEDPKSHI
jgi:YHS domain.